MKSRVLLTAITAAACSLVLLGATSPRKQTTLTATMMNALRAQASDAIRPFQIKVPEAALLDLRRRIAATRWPPRETVTDRSQGVQLARLQSLVEYWGTRYDWRKVEAKLNALPQFVTTIDGIDIHLIQVKSRHPNALPLIITHGWPGSVIAMLNVPQEAPEAFADAILEVGGAT